MSKRKAKKSAKKLAAPSEAENVCLCVLAKTADLPQNKVQMNVSNPVQVSEPSSFTGAAARVSTPDSVITVAFVEDEKWLRESLSNMIDSLPLFRCVGKFGTGEEAIHYLPAAKPDVVLMDINLPGMSGIECVRRFKLLAPETNILMLTVYEETERIFESLKAGASGYLLKRAPDSELLDAIVQVHAGGSPMTGLIARKVVQFFKQLPSIPAGLEGLSPREREILEYLSEGAAYKEIANNVGLSIHTIRMHIRGIYRKLHVHSRGEVVAKFYLR